jgi:hypothetical protein
MTKLSDNVCIFFLSPHSFFLSQSLATTLFTSPLPIPPRQGRFNLFIIMTNNTKKCTSNATRPSEDHLPASGSDHGNLTLEELREQNKELEHRLLKYKGLFFLVLGSPVLGPAKDRVWTEKFKDWLTSGLRSSLRYIMIRNLRGPIKNRSLRATNLYVGSLKYY